MQDILPIHFAPLQGYTDAFYRNAHAACFGGIDSYYTPFVRLEKDGFRNKDVREIAPESNQVPHLVPQLIATSIEKAETILSLFIEKDIRRRILIWAARFRFWLNGTTVPAFCLIRTK